VTGTPVVSNFEICARALFLLFLHAETTVEGLQIFRKTERGAVKESPEGGRTDPPKVRQGGVARTPERSFAERPRYAKAM
jgi:hypothetical protein